MPSPGPDWAEILQGIGSIISAAASLILVYIAINFRDEARLARRRPELELSHDPVSDATEFHDPHWNYDIYLRVDNKPGQDRAVQVGLELVSVRALGDTAPPATRPPRRSFAVAEMRDHEATEVDLPPNVARRFLLVYHDSELSGNFMQLAVLPSAKSGRDKLPPGSYELTVALTATNADATYWKTTAIFRGVTSAEEQVPSRLTITAPVRVLNSP